MNDPSSAMKRYANDESLSFPPAAELPRFLYSGRPETVVDVDHPSLTIFRGPHHFAVSTSRGLLGYSLSDL